MYRLAVSYFVVVLLVTIANGQRRPQLDGRIVGGEDALVETYPYQVSVRMQGSHICGGSILNANTIVTAAHCIFSSMPPSLYTIQYGKSIIGGTVNTIAANRVIKHDKYDGYAVDYDVALIFLSSNITFGPSAQPIALATQEPEPATKAVVTGWGTLQEGSGLSSSVLQAVAVQIVGIQECAEKYGRYGKITERMLCAGVHGGGKDACQGDSGGPLVADNQLVGIVSWGVGCARPEFPGVYSNVATLYEWIVDKVAKNSSSI